MKIDELVDELCSELQRGQLSGALAISQRTAKILRSVVTQGRYPDHVSLLGDIKKTGIKLQEAKPSELVIGNVVRRVLHLIREEHDEELKESSTQLVPEMEHPVEKRNFVFSKNLHSLLDLEPQRETTKAVSLLSLGISGGGGGGHEKGKRQKSWRGRQAVIDGINEFIEEVENIPLQIAQQGLDQIHANEVLLTYGYSDTILQFLQLACEKRPELEVIVAEAAPGLEGHKMARALAELKIKTTVIPDAAIFALMARVDQVFVGCHEILADGGIVAQSGIALVATAAKHHSVPFVVLVGTHKLSPLYPQNPSLTLNVFQSSHEIAKYEDFQNLSDGNAVVLNPAFDFLPPQSISLILTDHGGVTPSYIYRLLTEFYSKEDYVLDG
eukprot:g8210.t1